MKVATFAWWRVTTLRLRWPVTLVKQDICNSLRSCPPYTNYKVGTILTLEEPLSNRPP